MFKELFIEEISDDDVQYFYQLADQAKKSKTEVIKFLKDAGTLRDILADLTQRW